MVNKQDCLKVAVEITKEYARSESDTLPSIVLEETYKKLLELAEVKG